MKRNQDDVTQEEEQSKKMKMTTDSSQLAKEKTFTDLGQDELSVVLPYLPIGSIVMFALSSKANFTFVNDQVKNNICKYFDYDYEYQFADALRTMRCLDISQCSDFEDSIKEIAKKRGSISEITKHLLVQDISFQNFYDLLNVRKKRLGNEEFQVETICIENKSDNAPPSMVDDGEEEIHFETQIKTIEQEPVGYDLKNLTIEMSLNRTKFFKIMTKLKNLESLNLEITQEYYRPPMRGGRGRGKGLGISNSSGEDDTEDEKGEAFDDDFIYVPIMKNLKKLVIEKGFDNDTFIFEILPFCPNLEQLDFICKEGVGDELLNLLSKYCTKIKYLKIKTYDGATQFELEITDKGLENFLEKESQIEFIDIEPAAFISGAIFKRLGDFPTLKSFRTQRVSYNGGCEDQEEEVLFGGNPNPNLEYIDIGPGFKFEEKEFELLIHSLKKFAPNLKGYGELGEFSIQNSSRSHSVLKLYLETIETLDLDLHNFSLLDRCSKLKKVTIQTDMTSVQDKLLPNPNVIEIDGISRCFKKFSEIFPNVNIIRSAKPTIADFLCENLDAWPHLIHLDMYGLHPQTQLLEVRPNLLYIEPSNKLTPETFNYQWLELDILKE